MTSTFRNSLISEQLGAIETGIISSAQLAAAVRTEINRYEKKLQAWVQLPELAGIETHAPPRPLEGISVGVKDIIDVAGFLAALLQFFHKFRHAVLHVVGDFVAALLFRKIAAHVFEIALQERVGVLVDRVERPEHIDCDILFHDAR